MGKFGEPVGPRLDVGGVAVDDGVKLVCENRKARHDYHIEETYEAGVVLTGTEVKALRAGKAQLRDSHAIVQGNEIFLLNAHISPYEQGNRFNHEPTRTRKLLLHRGEINRLIGRVREKGFTLIPLQIYFRRGKAKVEIALAKGKRLFDKREAIAGREAQRNAQRAMKEQVSR